MTGCICTPSADCRRQAPHAVTRFPTGKACARSNSVCRKSTQARLVRRSRAAVDREDGALADEQRVQGFRRADDHVLRVDRVDAPAVEQPRTHRHDLEANRRIGALDLVAGRVRDHEVRHPVAADDVQAVAHGPRHRGPGQRRDRVGLRRVGGRDQRHVDAAGQLLRKGAHEDGRRLGQRRGRALDAVARAAAEEHVVDRDVEGEGSDPVVVHADRERVGRRGHEVGRRPEALARGIDVEPVTVRRGPVVDLAVHRDLRGIRVRRLDVDQEDARVAESVGLVARGAAAVVAAPGREQQRERARREEPSLHPISFRVHVRPPSPA